ncbi:MAG: copper chaperone PCu(A)C [Pseudomonadota bacterium]
MRRAFFLSLFLVVFSSPAVSVSADNSPDIEIENAWARALPAVAVNGAAYMQIRNTGASDTLLGASSAIANSVEVHNHIHENGVMKMVHLDTLEIASDSTVNFKPGGLHIMLLGLNEPLTVGKKFTLNLEFEKSGEQTITVEVRKQ